MNIVVAYSGPDTRLQGSVLRLRKRSATGSADADSFAPAPIQDSFVFLRDVVRPRAVCRCPACSDTYVGARSASESICARELLVLGELLHVKKAFLEELHETCLPHRPPERTHRDLDTGACHGWLLPDLAYIPAPLLPRSISAAAPTRAWHRVLSIEIKPKSCVLPRADRVRPQNVVKTAVSRFRQVQVFSSILARVVAGRL